MSEVHAAQSLERMPEIAALLMTCALGSGLSRPDAAQALLVACSAILSTDLGEEAAATLMTAAIDEAAAFTRARRH